MFSTQQPLPFSVPVVSPVLAPKHKARRDAIKAAGGAEYEELRERERAARVRFRLRHPDTIRANRKKYKRRRPQKTCLIRNARERARKRGLPCTITVADLVWPSHCPVLGIELNYRKPGEIGHPGPNSPSLDRWDNTKGYVPGNVFVISFRANSLKNSGTYAEILKVAKYLSRKPG